MELGKISYCQNPLTTDVFSGIRYNKTACKNALINFFPNRDKEGTNFGYSEKATKFEKIFHSKFDATQ